MADDFGMGGFVRVLGVLAMFGIAAVIALIVALPFGLIWLWHHVSIR